MKLALRGGNSTGEVHLERMASFALVALVGGVLTSSTGCTNDDDGTTQDGFTLDIRIDRKSVV